KFYTASGRASVTVWDSGGKFERVLGRPGLGPGEFGRNWTVVQFDPSGRLYVRDAARRWSIYSSSLEFLRTTAPVEMGYSPEQAVFLDDGRFLSAAPGFANPGAAEGLPENSFHIYDFWSRAAISDATPVRVKIVRPRARLR